MDSGQVQLSFLSTLFAESDQPAWIRAVGGVPTSDGATPLWRADIIVGPREPEPDRAWRYEACTFASATIASADLAVGMSADSPQNLEVGGVTFFYELQAHLSYHRKPCFAQHDEPPLSWPSVVYTGHLPNQQGQFQPPNGFLVGAGAPAFASFGVAFQAFFTGNYAFSGSSNPLLGQLIVRYCDLRGRITGLSIQPTGLEVRTDGASLNGARIELMATRDRGHVPVVLGGTTAIPLPHGLPEDAFVWLRTDDDWLDYRSLGISFGTRDDDIVDERPVDTAVDLAAQIAQGEGQHLEFKSQLPESTPTARRTALKSIVAFANGEGGTMLYGVDDAGTVVGLDGADARTPDRFSDILRSWTSPMPRCHARVEVLEERQILVVDVEPGGGTIHALTVEPDKPEYYVRRGATSFHARPEELQVIAAAQAKEPAGFASIFRGL